MSNTPTNERVQESVSRIKVHFMSRRIVTLGPIDSDSIGEVQRNLIELNMASSDPITLLIDSAGGSIDSALELCDMINHMLSAPIHAVVTGECSSAATFVLLNCAKKMGLPNTHYLIHSGRMSKISIPINGTTSQHLKHLEAECARDTKRVTELYMTKLSKRKKDAEALLSRGDQSFDYRMSAEEALECGLIDRIFTGKMDIFPSS